MAARWGYCLFLLPLVALAGLPADELPRFAPEQGLLVLRNGHVLEGKVLRSGDAYLLETAGGGTVRVPATSVDVACRDLNAAYHIKVERLGRPSAHERLDLAEWCLRMRLPSGAAEQLLEATRLDPDNPRIAAMERKLLVLAEPPPPPPAVSPTPAAEYLSAETLERTMEATPPAAIEAFTGAVQPLLLNRCGATTCHGPAATNGFHLTRPALGQPITRRITQRNLHAVLAIIDRAKPEASPLIAVPRAAHGPTRAPVFTDRDARQVFDLLQFISQLAPQAAAPPGQITPPAETLMQPAHDRRVAPPAELTPDQRQANRRVTLPAPFTPRDPFDPEIFNRQFHGVGK